MSQRVCGFPDELQELINMLLYFHFCFLPISELSFLLPHAFLPQASAVVTAAAVLAVWAAFKRVTQTK